MMRREGLTIFLVVGVLFGMLVATGCGPKFPKCDTDEDCRTSTEGEESGRLYCVNGLCQQCRTDENCAEGEQCEAGSCEPIPGYCTDDSACGEDEICLDNRCTEGCRGDDECEGDQVCRNNTCQEPRECTSDADCGEDEMCENYECVADPDAKCEVRTVYFGYDTSNLRDSARNALESNAECIKQRSRDVQLAGHADERGTNEYNLALGERRARSVYDYLKTLGVSASKMSTISYGEERLARRCGEDGSASCHEQNRRVEFNWQ